jgi:hypothetical protein
MIIFFRLSRAASRKVRAIPGGQHYCLEHAVVHP